MQEQFSTLTEAITSVFRYEEKSLLSLDRICQVLSNPNLFISTNNGIIQCSSISRRRISSILSSSDIFVRAGPPRSCMWALRPSNPLFLSDGALISLINQILSENGPLSTEGILDYGDLSGATVEIMNEFLSAHTNDYNLSSDNNWWFVGQPLPYKMTFDSVINALLKAFDILNRDASIEEISWVLCMSTLPQCKRISRRKISRELSRRPDLFNHISRAKYALISGKLQTPSIKISQPVSPVVVPQVPTEDVVNNNNMDILYEMSPKFDFMSDWSITVPQCETPPVCGSEYFDANEFFSIGFSGSFDF